MLALAVSSGIQPQGRRCQDPHGMGVAHQRELSAGTPQISVDLNGHGLLRSDVNATDVVQNDGLRLGWLRWPWWSC